MLRRVLVANRGEIACRILRTVRYLGLEGVAVYHHEDRAAPHLQMADTAVQLEAEVPSAAYLDQAQILAVARTTGVDAIHPGYGFLSENAAFAARVAEAGLVFVGPDAAVIGLMGDKIRARSFAAEQGVPVAPSVVEADAQRFIAGAQALGFPLLVKAAAGGGGKGMRIVRSVDELAECLRVAAAEAQRYFGDGRVYAERYIEQPRHIEVQVLGDGQGNVVHLYRARVLAAAPLPEDHRGVAGPESGRRAARGDVLQRRYAWRAPPAIATPARSSSCWHRTVRSTSWR